MRRWNETIIDTFCKISPETKSFLEAHATIQQHKRGTVIIRNTEYDDNILIQISGKSVVYNLTHNGNRKILYIFGPGVLLNNHVISGQLPSIQCELLEDGEVMVISKVDFQKAMAMDFQLTKAVMEMMEWKTWRLEHQLKNTVGSVYLERKLAAKLWKLSRDFGIETPEGTEIDIIISISFLADMLGAPRETTSRICSRFTDMGLIDIRNKRITVRDMQKLEDYYIHGESDK